MSLSLRGVRDSQNAIQAASEGTLPARNDIPTDSSARSSSPIEVFDRYRTLALRTTSSRLPDTVADYKDNTKIFDDWLRAAVSSPRPRHEKQTSVFVIHTQAVIAENCEVPSSTMLALASAIKDRKSVHEFLKQIPESERDSNAAADDESHLHFIDVLSLCQMLLAEHVRSSKLKKQMNSKSEGTLDLPKQQWSLENNPSIFKLLSLEGLKHESDSESDQASEGGGHTDEGLSLSQVLDAQKRTAIVGVLKDLESIFSSMKHQWRMFRSGDISYRAAARCTSVGVQGAVLVMVESGIPEITSMKSVLEALHSTTKIKSGDGCHLECRPDAATAKRTFFDGWLAMSGVACATSGCQSQHTIGNLPFCKELISHVSSVNTMRQEVDQAETDGMPALDTFTEVFANLSDNRDVDMITAFAAEAYQGFLDATGDALRGYEYLTSAVAKARDCLAKLDIAKQEFPGVVGDIPLFHQILAATSVDSPDTWAVAIATKVMPLCVSALFLLSTSPITSTFGFVDSEPRSTRKMTCSYFPSST